MLVCQGRAAADGLVAPDVFSDPVAVELLTDDERVPVLQVRAGTPPRGAAPRLTYESVRASATGMVPRTIAIDEAVVARPCPQLVVLGAGLDSRAWRMHALADVDVLEVDHPASQDDKRERVGDLVPVCGSLRFVAVDFSRDSLDASLESAGHDRSRATTWLWEGVVAYLTEPEVTRTFAAVAHRSAPGSRMVVNYQAPSVTATVGRYVAHAMSWAARQRAVWSDEPRRSAWTPERMAALVRVHGFSMADDADLLTVARQRALPVTHARSLASGRVVVADR